MVDNDLMIIVLLVILVFSSGRDYRETAARLDVLDERLKDLADALRRRTVRRGGE